MQVSYIIIKRWFITNNYYFSPQATNVNDFVKVNLILLRAFIVELPYWTGRKGTAVGKNMPNGVLSAFASLS